MKEDHEHPSIKITDRRHFDRTGARRPPSDVVADKEGSEPPTPRPQSPPQGSEPRREPREPARPGPSGGGQKAASAAAGRGRATTSAAGARAPEDLSEIARGLSSSFSLLVARLAQETEIYLGLMPYPGKETPEPDLEAARAMIDMLAMLQAKTSGNLDPEEAKLLENLLYTYRLEFVRHRSSDEAR